MFGLLVALGTMEGALRLGAFYVSKKQAATEMDQGREGKNHMLFAGDSWTMGADADPGKSFFNELKRDPDLTTVGFDNVGYGGQNYFQVVNSVLNYKGIPRFVILTGGINAWHMIGFEQFLKQAQSLLSASEYKELAADFDRRTHKLPWERLRLFKLFQYVRAALFPDDAEFVDMKYLDSKFCDDAYTKAIHGFQARYSRYQDKLDNYPNFLKECTDLTLDQIFYLTVCNFGFATADMEIVLKEAGLFFPEKLTVFPYSGYQRLNVLNKKFAHNLSFLTVHWSFKVLSAWAAKHNVTVFVQTYPNIWAASADADFYKKLNDMLIDEATNNGFHLIDHNSSEINWPEYRTPWHVGNEGHFLMKENIKQILLNYLATIQTSVEGFSELKNDQGGAYVA